MTLPAHAQAWLDRAEIDYIGAVRQGVGGLQRLVSPRLRAHPRAWVVSQSDCLRG